MGRPSVPTSIQTPGLNDKAPFSRDYTRPTESNVLKDSNSPKVGGEDDSKLVEMAHIRLNLTQQKEPKVNDYTPKYIPPPDLEKDVERLVQTYIGNLHLTVNNLEVQVGKLANQAPQAS